MNPTETEHAPARRRTRWLLVLVLAATFLIYAPTLGYEFVYDDTSQIVNNPNLRSWEALPGYFTRDVWSHREKAAAHLYRPLFLVWLRLNYIAFGASPAGWHLSTVLAHLVATLLVFLLARRLLADDWTALIAALIFGLHPVHLESVAWVAGVTDPLMSAAFLGAFHCYLAWREKRGAKRLAALVLFAVALLIKETAIVLPLLVALHAALFANRDGAPTSGPAVKSAIVAALPFALLATLYLVARHMALGGLGNSERALSLPVFGFTLPKVLWFYARLLVWPIGLSEFYDFQPVAHPGFATFWLPAIPLLAMAALAWFRTGNRTRFLLLMMLAPLGPPLAGILFLTRNELVHDRYLYLPSAGFAMLAALALGWLRKVRFPLVHLLVVLPYLLALAAATLVQSPQWTSTTALARRGVAIAPNNVMAYDLLADSLLQNRDYAAALPIAQRAHELDPDSWDTSYNLSSAYFALGDYPQAERYLLDAMRKAPQERGEYYYLLALNRIKMGRWPDAEGALRRGIQLSPVAPGMHSGLGAVLRMQGRLVEARDEYALEVKLHPDNAAAQHELADIEARLGAQAPR